MIQIDAALASIFITILIFLIGAGVAIGALRERVKSNLEHNIRQDKALEDAVHELRDEMKSNEINNRQDHAMIFTKLDKLIENGKH